MLKIGIPVIDQHLLTWACVDQLKKVTVEPESLEIVIIDNASTTPYPPRIHPEAYPFKVTFIRNEVNRGYYWPLTQVASGTTRGDLVGLMHNDMFIYDFGWDRKLKDAFINHGALGMVGVCGSNEVDDRGGRGGGTMCNFQGLSILSGEEVLGYGQLQEHTGLCITDLRPAIILDSMFMVMRQPVVDTLNITDHITLCHFMDKIWPMRANEKDWQIGVFGLKCDHMGGKTAVEQLARFEVDAARWCQQEGIPYGENQASLALYLESERQFLSEFRDRKKLIPGHMEGWAYKPNQPSYS